MTIFSIRSLLHGTAATAALTLVACGGFAPPPPDSSARNVEPPSGPAEPRLTSAPNGAGVAAPSAKSDPDMYHVYKRENGTCEVDMRSHDQEQSARGGHPQCLGHFTSNSSAMELRDKMQKDGMCKR